jgi:hypothetical protein
MDICIFNINMNINEAVMPIQAFAAFLFLTINVELSLFI